MASDFILPTSAELQQIAQDLLPVLTQEDPIFDYFPLEDEDAFLLMWEQMDNYTGLQQVRGLNGDPSPVVAAGNRRFMEEPGVYGEYIPLDETEMTMRRAFGVGTPDNAFAMPVDLSDLTAKRQEQLLQRRINRIRWILWTLAVAGTFTVVGKNGSTIHQGTYLRQTFTSTVSWSTFATATPLQDFRTVKLLEWGHSVSFGSDAKAFANRRTINKMLANTNGADLYGRRVTGLSTINDLPSVNSFFTGDNLPSIQEYNAGYLTDGSVVQSASDMTQYGTFTPFIPDDYIVLFGSRPGNQRIGAFKFIRNVNNPGMAPGPYMKVVDSADGDDGPPRRIEIHDGFNGGPIIEYPSAVVTMHVHT